jgi:hypothetical protein
VRSADLGIDCFNVGDETFTVAYHFDGSSDMGDIVVLEEMVEESEYGYHTISFGEKGAWVGAACLTAIFS